MIRSTFAPAVALATSMLAALAHAPAAVSAQDTKSTQDSRAFELRIYTAEDGKLEALHRRFREHTVGLFKKHGMEVVGFWIPKGEDSANTLVYLMAYPSQEARDASWKAFIDDPEWKAVYAESHQDGPLVKKVESRKLDPTDYSPMK